MGGQYCTVLYCIVLYCTVLYCTGLTNVCVDTNSSKGYGQGYPDNARCLSSTDATMIHSYSYKRRELVAPGVLPSVPFSFSFSFSFENAALFVIDVMSREVHRRTGVARPQRRSSRL